MQQPPGDQHPTLSAEDIKRRIREVLLFLPTYFRNPYESMKRVPPWDWVTVIVLEVLLAAASGVLNGIVSRNVLNVFLGLILGPFFGVLLSLIISAALYYCCLFILKTELEFKKIFVVVVLAKIPAQILGVLTPLAPPITLLRIFISAFLLIVGLVDNFLLDKKKVSQIVGGIAVMLAVVWLYGAIMEATTHHIKVQDYSPESLDQLQRELGESK